MIFEEKHFLRYILLIDQISLPDCLYLVFSCLNKVFKYYLYAAAVFSLQFIAIMLIILFCICMSLFC